MKGGNSKNIDKSRIEEEEEEEEGISQILFV